MNSRAIGGGIILVAVLAVTGGLYLYFTSDAYKDSRVIGQVGKHTFFYRDLKPYLEPGIDKTYAQGCLLEGELYGNLAGGKKVTVSDAEISTSVKATTSQDHPYAENYFRLCAKRDLLAQKLQVAYGGQITGEMVLVHFDQHIPFAGRNDTTNPPEGRDARIASDRAYANALVTDLHTKVASGAMTMTDAMKAEQDDARVGATALSTTTHSGAFDTSEKGTIAARLLDTPALAQLLRGTAKGGVTSVATLSVGVDPVDASKTAEGEFAFFKIESSQHVADTTFDQAVAAQKKLGYKVEKI